jgi:Protein of unknown function (DUF3352)
VNLPNPIATMPGSVKDRLVPIFILSALAALAVAGCGGDGEGGGTDPATVAPAKSPLYVELTLQPEGDAKANIEAIAKEVAGIEDLGELIVSELEESAADEGEEIDFEKEIEPWLGEQGGIFSPEYEAGDFEETGLAIQVTDSGAAEDFVDAHAESNGKPDEESSYHGVAYKIDPEDGETVGVLDELLVVADSEDLFERIVDASEGESLADEGSFTEAISHVPDGSVADVYVDVGAIVEASGEIEPDTQLFLETAGIEPEEATAVASAIPGTNQVEIDVSTDLGGDNPPSGDASELLGTLPGDSVAAFASPEFGKRFNEGIDQIDENGIPGEVPPHQLKKALKQSGIDLESIAASISDVGLFVEGTSERDLTGALVLLTDDAKQATNTVSNIGLFLRATGTPGITAINGKASGFSVRSAELGRQPVVVIAEESKIAIGYGLAAARAALEGSGQTLADSAIYKEAASALGSTPIAAYLDGPAALKLVSSLVPPGEVEFEEAEPYLEKIKYAALGSEASDGLATAKLIVGFGS